MRRLSIPPELQSLPLLYAMCEEAGVDARLMLALEEAFVNIANYSGAKWLEVSCLHADGAWTVTFEDDGREFDPTAFTPSDDPLTTGGRGIQIIRAMTDSQDYHRVNDHNILTITKLDNHKD